MQACCETSWCCGGCCVDATMWIVAEVICFRSKRIKMLGMKRQQGHKGAGDKGAPSLASGLRVRNPTCWTPCPPLRRLPA